ncbi:MAG: ATP-binding cassette domain-containing protein [Oscillospiraceae bacterium]|nr:ATP-binding cassette domain-containing protein [Oscillospiraceae bacterium]
MTNLSKGLVYSIEGEENSGEHMLLKYSIFILTGGKNIFYEGRPVEKSKLFLNSISYVAKKDSLHPQETFKKNIKLYMNLFDENQEFLERVYSTIKKLGYQNYKNYLVGDLSKEARYIAYLAIMFSKNSEVLILDEPFALLTKNTQKFFIELLKQKIENKTTIIMSTKIPELKALINKIVYVKDLQNQSIHTTQCNI